MAYPDGCRHKFIPAEAKALPREGALALVMQQQQNATRPQCTTIQPQRPMWQQQDAAATKHSSSNYLQQQLQLELMK